jgi:hypothetical protein
MIELIGKLMYSFNFLVLLTVLDSWGKVNWFVWGLTDNVGGMGEMFC